MRNFTIAATTFFRPGAAPRRFADRHLVFPEAGVSDIFLFFVAILRRVFVRSEKSF